MAKYTLRYLFYLPRRGFKLQTKSYEGSTRCAVCKDGGNLKFLFGNELFCIGGHKFEEEPNTSLKHRLYKVGKFLSKYSLKALQILHIVRVDNERYGIFGDEAHYVYATSYDGETGELGYHEIKRKWWEHIVIKKR